MSRSAPRHAAPKHARTCPSAAPSAASDTRAADIGEVWHHAATPVRTRRGLSRAAGIATVTAAVVAISGGGYVLTQATSPAVVATDAADAAIIVITASPSPTDATTSTPSVGVSASTRVPTPVVTARRAPRLTPMSGTGTVALTPGTLAARQRAADAAAAAAAAAAATKAQNALDAKDAQNAKDRAAAAERASRSTDRQPVPGGSPKLIAKALMLANYGWGDDQYSCLVTMWNHESNWNPNAENAGSGAYGIPQALPGNKMATYGADWRTNPATQISWGLNYIKTSYSTPCGAWSFWQRGSWY